MAKRYIRVNSGQGWENAPSVATPINKSNLNIMDKGIDDLDLYKVDTDAIANNLVTTEAGLVLDARQGKVLDGKVNELTNNLANVNFVNLGSSPNLDDIGDDRKIVVANYTDGNGQNIIISFYYLVSGNKYGTQLNMNFAGGLKFRTCDSNTWSEWVTK